MRTLTVIATAMLALAGCDGGAHGAEPSPSASAADGHAAWIAYVTCARANGHPDVPDPVQDTHGRWSLPMDPATIGAPACEQQLRQALLANRVKREPTAAEMAKLRQFARCVRDHGVPTYPDPGSDGVIDMPPGMRDDPALGPALVACQQYAPAQPDDK